MRILIIRGNRIPANLYKSALEAAGHAVVATDNGEMAWSRQFDLVISELELPNGSGERVARQMNDRGIRLPIVLMSDNHKKLKETGEPLVAIGIVRALLEGPISAGTLVSYVGRFFSP